MSRNLTWDVEDYMTPDEVHRLHYGDGSTTPYIEGLSDSPGLVTRPYPIEVAPSVPEDDGTTNTTPEETPGDVGAPSLGRGDAPQDGPGGATNRPTTEVEEEPA